MNSGVAVVIAGMPASGNRLIEGLLNHHGVKCQVHHHGTFEAIVQNWWSEALTVAVLLPVREVDVHRSGSFDKHKGTYPDKSYAHIRKDCYFLTMELASKLRLPVFPFRYKHLVNNPWAIGNQIMTWLGVPFKGWHTEIVDGDAKWLTSPRIVEDGSDSELVVTGVDRTKEIIAPISATLRGRARTAFGNTTKTGN